MKCFFKKYYRNYRSMRLPTLSVIKWNIIESDSAYTAYIHTEVKFTFWRLIGTRLVVRWLPEINVELYRRDENNADEHSNRK